jgi:hypothetical protein
MSIHVKKPRLSLECDKIRLNMSVLKMMGEAWNVGQREYRAVGTISREILSLSDEEIEMHEMAPVVPPDDLDFNLYFDVD